MDFGELIPLLIILGSVIWSFVSGAKKNEKKLKEQQANKPKPVVSQQQNMPSSQPVFWPDSPFEQPKPQPAEVSDIIRTLKDQSLELQKNIQKREKQLKKKEAAVVETIVSHEQPDAPPLLNIHDMDEIKKAVIYTEIFSRKKF